ncbi:hypothetical protein C8Q76DRAFT_690290 [Earliella scabrosa]|nr:hypothetical protein C8Q76DRAFT_690290 [Earliella scabrosa]
MGWISRSRLSELAMGRRLAAAVGFPPYHDSPRLSRAARRYVEMPPAAKASTLSHRKRHPRVPSTVPLPANGPVILVGSNRHKDLWVTQSSLPSGNLGDSESVHAILREASEESKDAVRAHRSINFPPNPQSAHAKREYNAHQSTNDPRALPSASSHRAEHRVCIPSPPISETMPSGRAASEQPLEDPLLWRRMHSAVDRALQDLLGVSDRSELEAALQQFLASQQSQEAVGETDVGDVRSFRADEAESVTPSVTLAASFRPSDVESHELFNVQRRPGC